MKYSVAIFTDQINDRRSYHEFGIINVLIDRLIDYYVVIPMKIQYLFDIFTSYMRTFETYN